MTWYLIHFSNLLLVASSEVDQAAKDAEIEQGKEKNDPTGGRGIDGEITRKLEQEPAQADKILNSAV